MERETKEISFGSHKAVVKTYATAREHQAIQSSYFTGAKVSVAGGAPTVSDFDPSVQFKVEEEMIRQMVVSLDGSPEQIVERCLDFPNDEYRDLVGQLDELVSKKKP